MKNLVNYLTESKSFIFTTTLEKIANFYLEGNTKDNFMSQDCLFYINGCEDDNSRWTFKTYEDWMKYFNDHKGDEIEINVYDGEWSESEINFTLPEVNIECTWDCICYPDEVQDALK